MAILGGVTGLAAFTKYPALVLVPVFILHGWFGRKSNHTKWFWFRCGGLVRRAGVVDELYGRFHLMQVFTRASEISRGTEKDGRWPCWFVCLWCDGSGLFCQRDAVDVVWSVFAAGSRFYGLAR